jgi:copper resistance protein B
VRLRACAALWLACAALARAQEPGEAAHVAPDPAQSHMHAMTYAQMAQMMGMDDRRRFSQVMLDRLEWQGGNDSALGWEGAARYGGDFNKLWLTAEGERSSDRTLESRTELAWDRIVTPWWSTRLGLRHDAGVGPSRDWAAFGIAGVAPGRFELEAGIYLRDGGRSALRLTTSKDYLLTQRLVLQPQLEVEAYGQDDPARLIGAGLSNITLGLRLRYELRREFAPFVGIRWVGQFGDSEALQRAAGGAGDELSWVAGIRAWF